MFVRLFFSSTLSVVFCVSVKKCVMPLVKNHYMNHWPWVVWFKEAEIVGSGDQGYCHRIFLNEKNKEASPCLVSVIHFLLLPRLQRLNRENKAIKVLTLKWYLFFPSNPMIIHSRRRRLRYICQVVQSFNNDNCNPIMKIFYEAVVLLPTW